MISLDFFQLVEKMAVQFSTKENLVEWSLFAKEALNQSSHQ